MEASPPLLLLLLGIVLLCIHLPGASADISCYTCGYKDLCPLPYVLDKDHDAKKAEAESNATEASSSSSGPTENAKEVRAAQKTSTLSCAQACIKFDGSADHDGKRVIVRGCHLTSHNIETNSCKEGYQLNGATGKLCTCNAERCNGAVVMRGASAAVATAVIGAAVGAMALWNNL